MHFRTGALIKAPVEVSLSLAFRSQLFVVHLTFVFDYYYSILDKHIIVQSSQGVISYLMTDGPCIYCFLCPSSGSDVFIEMLITYRVEYAGDCQET